MLGIGHCHAGSPTNMGIAGRQCPFAVLPPARQQCPFAVLPPIAIAIGKEVQTRRSLEVPRTRGRFRTRVRSIAIRTYIRTTGTARHRCWPGVAATSRCPADAGEHVSSSARRPTLGATSPVVHTLWVRGATCEERGGAAGFVLFFPRLPLCKSVAFRARACFFVANPASPGCV